MPLEIFGQQDLFLLLSRYSSQIIGGIILLAILGVVGLFLWKRNIFRRMPIHVEDWELSGSQVIPRQRRAARIKKKDEEYLLFRDGEKWVPQHLTSSLPIGKENKDYTYSHPQRMSI